MTTSQDRVPSSAGMKPLALVKRRCKEILFGQGTDWAELQLSVIMLLWGIWLMSLSPFSSNVRSMYVAMAAQAPDVVWGIGFVLIGGCTLVGVLLEQLLVRQVATMLCFVWWFYILLLYAVANIAVFAVPVSAVLAVTAAWCHVRLSVLRSHKEEARSFRLLGTK